MTREDLVRLLSQRLGGELPAGDLRFVRESELEFTKERIVTDPSRFFDLDDDWWDHALTGRGWVNASLLRSADGSPVAIAVHAGPDLADHPACSPSINVSSEPRPVHLNR